jgi:hypothetical protein
MHQLTRRLRARAGAQEGFSMIVVMIAMSICLMFVLAGLAAAGGDLRPNGISRDRKNAYAAAESGLNFYRFHLNQDNKYWLRCTNVPAPNATEPNPVNQQWSGAGADPRRWRNVQGSPAQYTIELLPAKGTTCVENDPTSMLNATTGQFRIRVTGRPSATSKLRRSIIASFRRKSFIDYVYFTMYETSDPSGYANPTQAMADCGSKYAPQRAGYCDDIVFADGDQVKGPFHTNDAFLVCGAPIFGRSADDAIESSARAPSYTQTCSGGPPVFNSLLLSGAEALDMPPSAQSLKTIAQSGGLSLTGTTQIRFNATGDITIANQALNNNVATNYPYPSNGVIYVDSSAPCAGPAPRSADYSELAGCAQVYVSGQYTKDVTIASANDVIVKRVLGNANGDLKMKSGANALLGLIANNYVRVYHDPAGPAADQMDDVQIDAAILSLNHSFIVDNWDEGPRMGTLAINGAIAQKYRGIVGYVGSTGYTKNYTYDDRLRYRSPPYFLDPVQASWKVVRSNEQVPAT